MQIEEGLVLTGKVTGITDFGAFIQLEDGKSGMVHISEVASGFVKNIKDHLSVGQEVKCKVVSVSPEGKISLSIRRAAENVGEQKQRPQSTRNPNPKVWDGTPKKNTDEKQSFEDMMASFKKISDDKMSDLKRADSKRGSMGYSRRGKK